MKKWMFLLAGVLLAGCASTPKIEKIPNSANAADEIKRLQDDMAAAADNKQADILAPRSWQEASDALKEAQGRQADNRDKERVLYSVAKARAWLNKADEKADQVASVVPDLLQVRKEAIEADARQYASDEFGDAEKNFRQYTRDRENSDFGITSDRRSSLRDNYIYAQTTALQNHYLGDARQNLHDAKKKGADTLVPNVWENAVRSYKNAQAFIAANRLDDAGIQKNCQKAVNDARNLNRITDEAVASKNASPEQRALALDRIKQRNRNLSSVLDQQAFEQKYDEARQMFTPNEAEVYKQGNRLLLRLKGIEFPTGSASLPPSAYPLITKVGGVIKDFGGSPQVKIEGHTDSTGSAKINRRLSQQRAEAVKTYLISNIGLAPESVEVVGISDTRPLASNKTMEGRAENRRVDVVVIPQVQDESPQIRQAQ
jgi:outer membrane protein OmpA-like peptidoglycan-associated protein/outer membrane murein-binding lipoprotein Lpp